MEPDLRAGFGRAHLNQPARRSGSTKLTHLPGKISVLAEARKKTQVAARFSRCGSQVVRPSSAKALFGGSIPPRTSTSNLLSRWILEALSWKRALKRTLFSTLGELSVIGTNPPTTRYPGRQHARHQPLVRRIVERAGPAKSISIGLRRGLPSTPELDWLPIRSVEKIPGRNSYGCMREPADPVLQVRLRLHFDRPLVGV